MQRDNTLQRLLSKKETPVPSDSFDDKVMALISQSIKRTTTNPKSLSLAWIFFLLGVVFGIIISTMFINTDTVLLGINLSDNGLIIQILCASIILLLFERLIRQASEIRNKKLSIDTD